MHERLSCKQLGLTHAKTPELLWKEDKPHPTNANMTNQILMRKHQRNSKTNLLPSSITQTPGIPNLERHYNPEYELNIMLYCNQEAILLFHLYSVTDALAMLSLALITMARITNVITPCPQMPRSKRFWKSPKSSMITQ